MLGRYSKAIVGGIVAVLAALATALQDGVITPAEWLSLLITLVVAGGGVFAVRFAHYTKAVVGAIIAGIGVLATTVAGGQHITLLVVVGAILAALTNLGVVANTPNAAASDPTGPAEPEQVDDDGDEVLPQHAVDDPGDDPDVAVAVAGDGVEAEDVDADHPSSPLYQAVPEHDLGDPEGNPGTEQPNS